MVWSKRRYISILVSPQPGRVDQAHHADITHRSNDEEEPDNEGLSLEIKGNNWNDDNEVSANTAKNGTRMSFEDYRAQALVQALSAQSLKDVDCSVVTATIGEATEIAWNQGQDKLSFFQ
jgi:Tfp pilus assembly protein PilX